MENYASENELCVSLAFFTFHFPFFTSFSLFPLIKCNHMSVKESGIIGHQFQLKELLRDIEDENIAHAYLFSGPRHLGKMTIAKWFAFKLLSLNVPEEKIGDLKMKFDKLIHPDLMVLDSLWIEDDFEDWNEIAKTSNIPQQHRAKNKAKTDTISIDDVRAIQKRLYETGTGKYKCCLVRSSERMQDEAANAFLKILEEPPPGVVFIMTVQEETSLLLTVVSRTRLVKFGRIPRQELVPLLENKSEDDIEFILHLSDGAPGTVISLRDNPDALRKERLLHSNAVSFWQSGSLLERLNILNVLHKKDEQSQKFLKHLSLALREQNTRPDHSAVSALTRLAGDLGTNAHRQLFAQRFALETYGMKHEA